MARNFPFDTQRQKALMEIYEKEASVQLENYLKSMKEENKNSLRQSKQSDVLRNRLERNRIPVEGIKDKLPQIPLNKSITTMKPMGHENFKESKKENVEHFGMIPPNARVRSFLYSGFSKEGKGR